MFILLNVRIIVLRLKILLLRILLMSFLTVYLLITVHFSEYGLFKSSMLENVLTDNVEAAKR